MTALLNRRYVLHEQIGRGGMGVVYRATDRLNGQIVALKQVVTAPENLAFNSKVDGSTNLRRALAGEFHTLASLRHPHIISVLDYGFDDTRQPYYTMEYLANVTTITESTKGKSHSEKLHSVIQILQALVYLHRRGILHRDLKPGNVMVAGEQVKVVDFGLSVATKTPSAKHITQSTAGTLAYMAPELFAGAPVTRASDLYAVGVIAFELFAGHHPFNDSNIAQLVAETLTKAVDVTSLGLEADLAHVIERLLAKTADARYNDASEVIRDLCRAADLSLPPETAAIRESFLQAAKFVGRDAEFAQMTQALDAALERRGSTCLVGGESGVGKSRLLEELRTLALVNGVVVLRGHAVSEGGAAYHVWRDVLRWLGVLGDISDDEAAILKTLVTDLGDLLERSITDLPPLDPQTLQNSLFALVAQLIRRLNQPVLIILEDLQWAGSESLALLNHLKAHAKDIALLLIGSYRDDEFVDLPREIPDARVLRLQRLSKHDIGELSTAMLGTAGTAPHVIDLLERETEGNVFFVVEVVRALTEDVGLDQLGRRTLPERIFAGGVQTVIQRRLRHVPENAYALLRLAAVGGRNLDARLLQALDMATDLDTWLSVCSNAVVLEVQDGRWRFTHDKLREYLLQEMTHDERVEHHRRVAEALETVYPDNPEQAAALVHLWNVAGDNAKELYYAERAGQQAINNGAYIEGIRFLQRALELLLKQANTHQRAERELRLQLMLGPAMMNYYGHSHHLVGETYAQAAQLGQATRQANTVFRVLWGSWVNKAAQANYPTAHSIIQQMSDLADQTRDSLHRLETIHAGWSTAIWQGATRLGEEYVQQGISLYDRSQHHQGCVAMSGHDACICALQHGSFNAWLMGFPELAMQRARAAQQLSEELNHPFSRSFGFFANSMIGVFRRDMDLLEACTEEFVNFTTANGFTTFKVLSAVTHGWYLAYRGRLQEAMEQILNAVQVMRQSRTYNFRPLVINTLIEINFLAGRINDGIQLFHSELAEYPVTGERFVEPELRRLYAELLLRTGEEQQAERELQLALDIARKQEAKSLELRAGMSLARLWDTQGKRAEAHLMLSDIYGCFTEGFDTPDLKDAGELLTALM